MANCVYFPFESCIVIILLFLLVNSAILSFFRNHRNISLYLLKTGSRNFPCVWHKESTRIKLVRNCIDIYLTVDTIHF